LSAAFLGSGAWYSLGNGFTYQYTTAYDIGYFKDGASYRFRYRYGTGQWENTANTLSWQALGAAGLSAEFMGGSGWHNLGNSFSYQYTTTDDIGYFRDGAADRFRYLYASRQWENSADTVSWQALGVAGLSAAFLGSGTWYSLGNGFTYQYTTAYDIGYFKDGASYRFRYRYGTGQWESTANTLSWQSLGAAGLSAVFVGDGEWYSLGSGFTYRYTTADDIGYYKDGDFDRFRYLYGSRQWESTGNTLSWQPLGVAGLSAAFVGSGAWYNLSNGFAYQYTTAYDIGYFKDGASYRFRYRYGPGQWESTGNILAWRNLGNTGVVAQFPGDGTYHDIGNGFWYQYASNQGEWSRDGLDSGDLLRHAYATGQWEHRDYWGYWLLLGGAQLSASFLGDGAYHDLETGFWYRYSADMAFWSRDGLDSGDRFRYAYATGQWDHRGASDSWWLLTPGEYSGSFIGDETYRLVNGGVWFRYLASSDTSYWSFDGTAAGDRFSYLYGKREWDHKGYGDAWSFLGNGGAAFLGDGSYHALDAGLWYLYDGSTGTWSTDGLATGDRFRYTYDTGQWEHKDYLNVWFMLGGGEVGGDFIGDGTYHSLGNGFWYQYLSSAGEWSRDGLDSGDRFRYAYNTGQWDHNGYGDTWNALGAPGLSAMFLGDGTARYLASWVPGAWWFTYNSGTDRCEFAVDSSVFYLFAYDYSGTWWHHDNAGWKQLGTIDRNSAFMGDSGPHSLGNWHGIEWWYSFDHSSYKGIFSKSAGADRRFAYSYMSVAWSHYGYDGIWKTLGTGTYSADFIGDGGAHGLGTWYGSSWRFTYDVGADRGDFAKYCSSPGEYRNRLAYGYSDGSWWHYGATGGFTELGQGGYTADFIGDATSHDLGTLNGTNWLFFYSGNWDESYFTYRVGENFYERFAYDYVAGLWRHRSYGSGMGALGPAGASSAFVGDGNPHSIGSWYGTVWYYSFDRPNDLGEFSLSSGSDYRFAYGYSTGGWQHCGFGGTWHQLGTAGRSNLFIGDGQYHNLGIVPSYLAGEYNRPTLHFKYSGDQSYFATYMTDVYTDIYRYGYASGQWAYQHGSWFNLSTSGKAADIGNAGCYISPYIKWTFASGIDPTSFNFDTTNSNFYFLAYDSNSDHVTDRIDYYDNRGHKVMAGVLQHNSRGSRIAIDRSYVTGYASWASYYQYWTTGTPYSPMVLVIDSAGHELFKEISVQHLASVGGSPSLRDTRGWIWEDKNGNGVYDSNWSESGDRIIPFYQQKGATCGIFATINISAAVWGNGATQHVFPTTWVDDVISWYSTYCSFSPSYNPATMNLNDPAWVNYGGTDAFDRNAYLTSVQGFLNSDVYAFNWTNLVNWVESGKLCHVRLDAYKIWASYFPAYDSNGTARDADYDGYIDAGYTGSSSYSGGWHAVWVRGFVRDAQNNITHVILADSGQVAGRGAFAKVAVSHFLNACSDFTSMIGYVDPPTGKTWSTQGVNTWTFNPSVYSASW